MSHLSTSSTAPVQAWSPGQHRAWLGAQVFCLVALALLGWLLARLVWIYYFFGLFFFLVAGLLVGAVAFRVARSARPVPTRQLIRGVIFTALCSTAIIIVWEFRHFADTVGQPPKFAEARNKAVASGHSPREVQELAAGEFIKYLKMEHPPGGAMGYVLWAIRESKALLTVDQVTETIVIDHKGWVWALRTTVAGTLLAAGLWFSLESLRSSIPVRNVLQPGEEYEEEL